VTGAIDRLLKKQQNINKTTILRATILTLSLQKQQDLELIRTNNISATTFSADPTKRRQHSADF
jgi:hypothetical protein